MAGLVLGALFLWAAMRGADLAAALAGLALADWRWCAGVFLAGLGFMTVKSLRWGWLLAPVASPPFRVLQRSVYIGSAANMVVPHLGEVLRATLLAQRAPIPVGVALGTVAVERVLDMAAIFLVTIPLLLVEPTVPSPVWVAALTALVIVVVGTLVIVDLMMSSRSRFRRLAIRAGALLPPRLLSLVATQAGHLQAGVGVLRTGPRLAVSLALSVLQWAAAILAVWASIRAVGVAVTPGQCIAVFILAVVGLTLPSAPATLGTTQLAFVTGLALTPMSSSATAALAASFVYTVWFIVAVMMIGGLWWCLPDGRKR